MQYYTFGVLIFPGTRILKDLSDSYAAWSNRHLHRQDKLGLLCYCYCQWNKYYYIHITHVIWENSASSKLSILDIILSYILGRMKLALRSTLYQSSFDTQECHGSFITEPVINAFYIPYRCVTCEISDFLKNLTFQIWILNLFEKIFLENLPK